MRNCAGILNQAKFIAGKNLTDYFSYTKAKKSLILFYAKNCHFVAKFGIKIEKVKHFWKIS